jgi:NADH:ubiquinone oxidoreductase subunit 4 (subunit M)
VADLNGRERAILAALVVAVFWLGLFPQEAMRKTETAARQYQQWIDVAARPGAATAQAPAAAAASEAVR